MTRMMLAALALLAGWATAADAGCFCRSCGGGNCSKVCRLVPDVTKVTTYEYCLVCEDFCLHGHSKCVGCKKVCDCQGCCKCEKVMQPTCCGIRTKAKLMKIPVVEEKHGWKCVVVSRCRGCNHCAEARPATATETRLALDAARQQGLLQVSYEEPILVAIPDDEPAAEPSPPAAQEAAQPTPGQSPTAFGRLFGVP
ncbi:MAG: hypothetical protein JNL96_12720 [Planctomycetaceae bacterium]|nr:hypothetical protein [Planctomycetaceae bacterium]